MAATNGVCTVCGGTGWKPVGPEASGRGVVRCDCMAQASFDRRWRAARIPARYQHCDFSSFQANVHDEPAWNQSLSAARLQAEAFVRDFLPGRTEFGLLFMGPSGVGKTHLGVAVLRALLERGTEALFCDFRELLKTIQDSYNPVSQATEMQVLSPVLESEVLLLDDLGASKPSAWVQDTVAHIINTRYNDRRVTLITTNYLDAPTTRAVGSGTVREDTLADRIGERMRSRLYEMCRVIEMRAEDFRRRVKQAQYHLR